MVLWYALNGLYLTMWSILLVHCLRTRQFYPIIGRHWGTKALWLLTFVFFNPLLTLLYFAFAFLPRPRKSEVFAKPIYFGSFVAILSICVVLVLFEVPLSGSQAEPVVVLSGYEADRPESKSDSFRDFEPQIGILSVKNSVQTYSSASTEINKGISTRNIMLICRQPHRLLDKAAREFQKSLARLPYVDTVTYYSFGTRPEPGKLLPDVFITLDMSQVDEKKLFRGRSLEANIKWEASNTILDEPSCSVETNKGMTVNFDIESELNYNSMMMGIESPRAKYKLEANSISKELIKSITKQFENLLAEHGKIPQLPDILYGSYCEPPEFSFVKGEDAEMLVSGSGLLVDNHTIWKFMDGRRTNEALAAYGNELESLGWTLERCGNEYLSMQNGSERICFFRQQWRDLLQGSIVSESSEQRMSEAPMIAHYESCWSHERIQKVMDALLDGDVGIQTLLVFAEYFHTPQQLERLRSVIEQSPVPILDGYLVLARYWSNRGEIEKGRKALMLARAMQRAEKAENVRAREIEDLAEKLGDESLAEAAVGEYSLRETGFVNVDEIGEPLRIERELDEPVLFYRRLDDEQFYTLALRIIRSREPSLWSKYRLLVVEKQQGNSSSSETDMELGQNGVWGTESYLPNFSGKDMSIKFEISSSSDERFCFTVTVGSFEGL